MFQLKMIKSLFAKCYQISLFSLPQAVAHELLQYDVQSFKDQDLKRRIKKLSDIGYASLPEDQFAELTDAISNMTETYATAKVCDYVNRTKCDLSLESDLLNIMAVTSLPGELEYYWTQWHDVAGTPSRSNFKKYIELTRVSSRRNSWDGIFAVMNRS